MNPLPWLLVAVPHEHRAFVRTVSATLRRHPTSAWRCPDFVLVETGVGGGMVRQTLDWLLTQQAPSRVFLAGFAGALVDDLAVGDAIRVSEVVDPAGVRRTSTWPIDLPYRLGTLLTTDHLVAAPDDKRRLAVSQNAVAVDMETSYVAEWCDQKKIEWACVRVISDDVGTAISKDVFDLLENGHVSPWRLTKAILRRPAIVRELLQLQRSTKKAATVIAKALQASFAERASDGHTL